MSSMRPLFDIGRGALEWISRLFWLNLLWLAFSALGLVVFGIWPATAAMFGVSRSWVRSGAEGSVAQQFWTIYRQTFWRANAVGIILSLLGALLGLDVRLTAVTGSPVLRLLEAPLIALWLGYLVTVVWIWPVFAHYQTGVLDYFRISFIIGICRPLRTLAMVGVVAATTVLSVWLQGVTICVGAAWMAICLTWLFHTPMSRRVPAVAGRDG